MTLPEVITRKYLSDKGEVVKDTYAFEPDPTTTYANPALKRTAGKAVWVLCGHLGPHNCVWEGTLQGVSSQSTDVLIVKFRQDKSPWDFPSHQVLECGLENYVVVAPDVQILSENCDTDGEVPTCQPVTLCVRLASLSGSVLCLPFC